MSHRTSAGGRFRFVMVIVAPLVLCGAAAPQITQVTRDPAIQPRDSRTPAPPAELDRLAAEALSLNASSIQTLAAPANAETNFLVPVALDGVEYTLALHPYSMRSPDFRVMVPDGKGGLIESPAPPPATVRGEVLEIPGSRVAGSVRDGQLWIQIRGGGEAWAIQPVSDATPGVEPSLHVVFNERDVIVTGEYSCGNDEFEQPILVPPNEGDPALRGGESGPASDDEDAPQPDDGGPETQSTGLEITEIGADADFEFYQDNDSSVPETVFDIEDILNRVELIYETDVQITYEETVIVVRTAEPDPYTTTNHNDLLDEFQAKWNSTPESYIPRDVAHLFTGKDLNGGVVGVASLAVICNTSQAYGLSQSHFTSNITTRTGLTAHEEGHNWSAFHCDGDPDGCNIMCSVLGACSGILTEFEPAGIASINAHKASRSCLKELENPIYPPFFDDFPSTTLDGAKWIWNKGGTITIGAQNEPSAPNSLNLDADGSALYRDDEIRTNYMLLEGKSNLTLSYWVEARNIESGKELFVEYRNDDTTWVEINYIVSDGTTQNNFTQYSHALPADAYHDEFRVRFRTAVGNEGDDWFIDDVRVGDDAVGEVWMSFKNTFNLPGFANNFQDEDIVAFDLVTAKWSWIFDGSDVGLGAFKITGMAVVPSTGEILLSFAAAGNIPGLIGGPEGELIQPHDIVRFTPTQLGSTTAGTFTFHFDGSDVGLDDLTQEKIDAITLNESEQLILSLIGTTSLPGLNGIEDEDLIRFNHTSLGSDTAGTWILRFDGSDVGLASFPGEDIDAASMRPSGGLGFLLSTNKAFTVPGISGNNKDIFEFAASSLGTNTAGTFSHRLRLALMGIDASENVGSAEYVAP